MPTRTIPLSKSVTATAGAAGTASASIGPTRYGDVWTVDNVMVQNSTPPTSTNSPSAVMEAAGVPQAGTYSGAQDSASPGAILRQGQVVKATWSGCDVGSTCTLSVYGSREITGG